jgi:hypothetical protein
LGPETCRSLLFKLGWLLIVAGALTALAVPTAAVNEPAPALRAAPKPDPEAPRQPKSRPHASKQPVEQRRPVTRAGRRRLRVTVSLYERTTRPAVVRQQGCHAGHRGVGGIMILDFGKPAWNGHTYGTILFSNRFAGNRRITRTMLAYARAYVRCLPRDSKAKIVLARGTTNYRPIVPSTYKAGRKWARETMALAKLLRTHGLADRVTAAAADDVEPAWDRAFHRTRDFFRGFRDARTGHLLYNFGSLDGGIGSIWSARQAFFVSSGMRYSRAIPEIYNHAMARQWAHLSHVALRRYHRPIRFAGVITQHRARCGCSLKPAQARRMLVRALVRHLGEAAPDVPLAVTNIKAPS